MRRVLLLGTLAALMAAMMVVSPGVASAKSGGNTSDFNNRHSVVQSNNNVFVFGDNEEDFGGTSFGGLNDIDDLFDDIDNDGIDNNGTHMRIG